MAPDTSRLNKDSALRSEDLLRAITARIGFTPSIASLLAEQPDILALVAPIMNSDGHGLSPAIRQSIGIAVAQEQLSGYCLSMHVYLAAHAAKLSSREIALNQDGQSDDARTDPLVRFAIRTIRTGGHVTEGDIAILRSSGISQDELGLLTFAVFREIAFTFLTNILSPPLDFPAHPLATGDV